MKKMIALAGAVALMVAAFAAPSTARRGSQASSLSSSCVETDGDLAGTITYQGPAPLWPPNNKWVTTSVVATDGNSDTDDTVSLSFQTSDSYNSSGISPASGSASGNGSASHDVRMLAQRSGRNKTGRTYKIWGEATFTDVDLDDELVPLVDATSTCEFEFEITIPHDRGKHKGKS